MLSFDQLTAVVRAYALKLTHDPELAADVAQDVLLKAHQALGTLTDHDKLVPWVRRIIYTTLIDHHRLQQRHRQLLRQHLAAPPEAEPRNEGNEAVIDCLQLLIGLLPPAQRELLEAVELRGESQVAYAAARALPLSTVKSRVQRARLRLRAQIQGHCFLRTDAYGNVVDFRRPEKNAALT